ncbi:hypothetical protein O0L34_g7998 [Tuta absoluta]|nr:hypothetical protein O0L34_g7998 [Tuta absoluta]
MQRKDQEMKESKEQEIKDTRRKSERTRKIPDYLKYYELDREIQFHDANIAYCLFNESDDSKSYKEAAQKAEWVEAIESELKSLEKLKTWEHVIKAIDTKWVSKTKQDGRKKAKLVPKGF